MCVIFCFLFFKSSDEETKAIRERIVSIRRKIHKNTVNAVTARWNFEEGVSKRLCVKENRAELTMSTQLGSVFIVLFSNN